MDDFVLEGDSSHLLNYLHSPRSQNKPTNAPANALANAPANALAKPTVAKSAAGPGHSSQGLTLAKGRLNLKAVTKVGKLPTPDLTPSPEKKDLSRLKRPVVNTQVASPLSSESSREPLQPNQQKVVRKSKQGRGDTGLTMPRRPARPLTKLKEKPDHEPFEPELARILGKYKVPEEEVVQRERPKPCPLKSRKQEKETPEDKPQAPPKLSGDLPQARCRDEEPREAKTGAAEMRLRSASKPRRSPRKHLGNT